MRLILFIDDQGTIVVCGGISVLQVFLATILIPYRWSIFSSFPGMLVDKSLTMCQDVYPSPHIAEERK